MWVYNPKGITKIEVEIKENEIRIRIGGFSNIVYTPFKGEVKAKLFFNFYLKFLILCALISCINR